MNKNKYLPSFWYNGKKVYTCRNSFKDEDANILCKSEGFDMGGIKIENNNKDPKPPINKLISFASNFSCPQDSDTIGKKCKVMILPEDQTCDENYQLIKCYGEKTVVQNYIAQLIPPLREPLSEPMQATCDTNVFDLNGDPGSRWVVRCPDNCQESSSKLEGVAIYSADSSICKAAIQMGVLRPGLEGIINVTLKYPMKFI